MDSLILFVLTVVLGVVLSWLLDRHDGKEVGGGVSASTAVEDFFVRIQKAFRLNAPGGMEGDYSWTQTCEEIELLIPLEPRLKSKDIDFRILPSTITLGLKGVAAPLLEVRGNGRTAAR